MGKMTVDELKDLLGKVTPGPLLNDSFAMQGDHDTRIAFPDRYGVPGETVGEAFQNWNDAGRSDQRISWKQAEANARLWSLSPQIAAALIEAMDELKFYASKNIYKPHPHGVGFDRRETLWEHAAKTLSRIDAILEGKG